MKRLHMHIGILALASILAGSAAIAADQPKDVRDIMTANQYRNAGLDKLSAAQMTALNADITNISVLAVANGPANLENILTGDQYRTAGLDTLSAEQVAALNGWLTGYLRAQEPAATASVSAAAPAAPASAPASGDNSLGSSMLKTNTLEPDSVESTIKGVFQGWSGDTIFTLANGQVWQQSEPADYSTHMQDPTVIIKKMHFGYLLTLPGNGQTVFVIRIK